MTAAAEKVAGNIDLLCEILIRVPLKSLLLLKCVSKQWLTLISDQQFLESHSLHHQQHQLYPNSLIFTHKDHPIHILSLTSTTTPTPTKSHRVLNLDFLNQSGVTVVHSCNGLLLCRLKNDTTTYFICNPITQNFTTLDLGSHPCRDHKNNKSSIELYLAFELSISPSSTYKVVSVAALYPPHDWLFHVYTFKTGCRIGPGVFVYCPFPLDAANGVYCNGVIHWCNLGYEFSVYFDIHTQRLKNYPMPHILECFQHWFRRGFAHIYYFGESGGRLHLMLPSLKENMPKSQLFGHSNLIDIFELKEDYSKWSLMHRLDLKPMRVKFPQITWKAHSLSFCIVRTPKDKKKSSLSVLIVGMEGVICYDCVDKTSTKLCNFEIDLESDPLCVSFGYGRILQHFERLC